MALCRSVGARENYFLPQMNVDKRKLNFVPSVLFRFPFEYGKNDPVASIHAIPDTWIPASQPE